MFRTKLIVDLRQMVDMLVLICIPSQLGKVKVFEVSWCHMGVIHLQHSDYTPSTT